MMLSLYIIGSDDARPSYCVFSIFKMAAVMPAWIWYDVIEDHPQLVFDGPPKIAYCEISRFLLACLA